MAVEVYMMTTIYLVRHAASIYSTDEMNRPISENGRLDADELFGQFEALRIDKVYSSPYKRAIDTVERISKSRELPVNLVNDFRERTKTNGKLDDFLENMAKLWQDEAFKFIGGESNAEGKARGIHALESILEVDTGMNIVISTHGDLMALILNYYDQTYGYEFWRKLDMPDAYKVVFEDKKIKTIAQVWARQ